MKFWFGGPGWGWRLWGVSHGDKWFFGLSIKQGASHDRLLASLEAAAKEAHDYTNMPMEVDPRDILELSAHIRELLEERDALKAENDRLKEALDR